MAATPADARPVYLFSGIADSSLYEGIDVRDSQNRVLSDAKSVLMLRETFAVSLYQILMVRGAPIAAMIKDAVARNLPDCSSLGLPARKFITGAKSPSAIISERSEKIAIQFSAAFLSVVTMCGVFILADRRPPVFVRSFEVLRC